MGYLPKVLLALRTLQLSDSYLSQSLFFQQAVIRFLCPVESRVRNEVPKSVSAGWIGRTRWYVQAVLFFNGALWPFRFLHGGVGNTLDA